MDRTNRRTFVHLLALLLVTAFSVGAEERIDIRFNPADPLVAFAVRDLKASLEKAGYVVVATDAKRYVKFDFFRAGMGPQSFRIHREGSRGFRIVAGDSVGAMYGGLELAEQISLSGSLAAVQEMSRKPYVLRRGLKFNIPFDGRTPSYDDTGDAAQKNIGVMWDFEFWRHFIDTMARNRYNVLSLWTTHPYGGIVKLPKYPEVNFDDVARITHPLTPATDYQLLDFDLFDSANHEIIRKITLDQKIDYWTRVFDYAEARGIEIYIFHWNIFLWNALGKYGITYDQDNPKTIEYVRYCVAEFLKTYPQIDGIGVSAGEHVDREADWDIGIEEWLHQTYGMGVLDTLKENPNRRVRFIFRHLWSDLSKSAAAFKDFDTPFNTSHKYARARVYSTTTSPYLDFEYRRKLEETGVPCWLNIRNDDVYVHRWGDADHVREFLQNIPRDVMKHEAGFYMGPDGYVWGKEFVARDPELAGQWEVDKHWYRFMLWGRLSYDLTLPRAYFKQRLHHRYPEVGGAPLYDTWAAASRIIPQVNRFAFCVNDHMFTPEGCVADHGFLTIDGLFSEYPPLAGSRILSVEEYAKTVLGRRGTDGITPLEVADNLDRLADQTLVGVQGLRKGARLSKELAATLTDMESMAYLGRYYADKIRGAAQLAVWRADRSRRDRHKQAVAHLSDAVEDWEAYTRLATSQYRPQLLSRTHYLDWERTLQDVRREVEEVKSEAEFDPTLVQIVQPDPLSPPALHGIQKLCDTLRGRGLRVEITDDFDEVDAVQVIVAGLASNHAIAAIVEDADLELPREAESMVVQIARAGGRPRVTLCGADAVGLMYAALDTAERIGWTEKEEDVLRHVQTRSESPFLTDRSVSTYTMHRKWFEQRLHNPDYWSTYFDMLAASRFNNYVIIFGYECAGFMAPMYPYFFDVEGFPDIKFNGLTKDEQTRNAAALRRVVDLAHERGIRVTLGIWDHIYRGKVQAGGIEWAPQTVDASTPHVVSGVTAENMAPYTKAALRRLLEVFPHIDALQFRMHWESGLTHEEIPPFWKEVFSMLRQLKPGLRFDLRAKGLPDEVIDNAIEENLPFRIATKFWMEQIGLPFHPTHVNPENQHDRRHGYADLTRFPRRFDLHWRIWSAGTLRVLLWGDPDHVRRFVQDSATVYGGSSFEVNEMLATKMLGNPHEQEPFRLHLPAYRHYDYEIERYWHFVQVWGRLSYDPRETPEVWRREFVRRFGAQSGPLIMRALHRASGILPRIVAASYNYDHFPTTLGWAGMMRLGDMEQYAAGTGTDVEQFQSYADAARQMLADGRTTLRTPHQSAAWLDATARRVLEDVETAAAIEERRDGRAQREFSAACADLRILAGLAQYHAARMPAAVWYNIYLQTEDRFTLAQCLAGEAKAIVAWKRIVEAAEGVYPKSLRFGAAGNGFPDHWEDELSALAAGYERLGQLPGREILDSTTRARLIEAAKRVARSSPTIDIDRPASAVPGRDLIITAAVESSRQLRSVRLRYRHFTQFEDYRIAPMSWDAERQVYVGVIPGDFIVPEWEIMYFVEAIDHQGGGVRVPDLEHERPYVIVPVAR